MRKGYGRVYAGILFIILVIGIIIYGVLKYAKKEVDSEQFETIKTDMLLIEAKTSIVAQKVKIKEKDAKYIGNKIENDENEDIKKLEQHGIIELKKENNKLKIEIANETKRGETLEDSYKSLNEKKESLEKVINEKEAEKEREAKEQNQN